MDLTGFSLHIVKSDGSLGTAFRTHEKVITIGNEINRDIRIRAEGAEPLMCKISADQVLKVRDAVIFFFFRKSVTLVLCFDLNGSVVLIGKS